MRETILGAVAQYKQVSFITENIKTNELKNELVLLLYLKNIQKMKNPYRMDGFVHWRIGEKNKG